VITIVGARSYVPGRILTVDDDCRPELTREAPAEWEASCNYLKDFITSCDFAPGLIENAVLESDIDALRFQAGFRAVAIEDEMTIPDMCLKVCNPIVGAATPAEPLSTIICCQASLDAEFTNNESSVLRLQCEYGLKELGFSVSDHDGANVFCALALIEALHTNQDAAASALLCCAERWRQPFPRMLGRSTILGDGAGALVLTNADKCGWKVLGVRHDARPDACHPWRALLQQSDIVFPEREITELILATLSECDLRISDVTAVIPPHVNKPLVQRVHRTLGINGDQWNADDFGLNGFICSADPIVRLTETLNRLEARTGDRLLVWGAGLAASYGCAVLEYSSSH
jgi:3-oxoacyl-[acyl-carrier-protein] synthase-3